MLFGKRKQVVKRILVVEDEPLTAFDTETMLSDFGYEVVATVDDLDEALAALDGGPVHLVIADIVLHGEDHGLQLAKVAREKGIPTLLATGHLAPSPPHHALGWIKKPYGERQLRQSIEAIDRHLQGERVKLPKGLELFVVVDGSE